MGARPNGETLEEFRGERVRHILEPHRGTYGILQRVGMLHKLVLAPVVPSDIGGERDFFLIGVAYASAHRLRDMEIAAGCVVAQSCVVGSDRIVGALVIVDQQVLLGPDVGGVAIDGAYAYLVFFLHLKDILQTGIEIDAVQMVGIRYVGVVEIAA